MNIEISPGALLVWVTLHDFEVIASGDVKVEINGKFIRHFGETGEHGWGFTPTVGGSPPIFGANVGYESPGIWCLCFGFNQISICWVLYKVGPYQSKVGL